MYKRQIHNGDEEKIAAIHSGFAEILGDKVTFLAELAEWPDEIDIDLSLIHICREQMAKGIMNDFVLKVPMEIEARGLVVQFPEPVNQKACLLYTSRIYCGRFYEPDKRTRASRLASCALLLNKEYR